MPGPGMTYYKSVISSKLTEACYTRAGCHPGRKSRDLLKEYLYIKTMTEILLRYLHFLAILTIAATVLAEYLLLKPVMTRREIGRLAKIDAVYGLAAVVLLGAGLTLWLGGVGKPSFFYTKNWIFHLKVGLFALVGILSIYPTVYFLKHRKGDPDEKVTLPSRIVRLLQLELLLLLIIPLLATLMSRGIGL